MATKTKRTRRKATRTATRTDLHRQEQRAAAEVIGVIAGRFVLAVERIASVMEREMSFSERRTAAVESASMEQKKITDVMNRAERSSSAHADAAQRIADSVEREGDDPVMREVREAGKESETMDGDYEVKS